MEIDYRWTSRVPMFWKFHWSIAVFFPLFLVTRLSQWTFYAFVAYAVFLLFAARKKFTPVQYVNYLWIRFVYGFNWRVR